MATLPLTLPIRLERDGTVTVATGTVYLLQIDDQYKLKQSSPIFMKNFVEDLWMRNS